MRLTKSVYVTPSGSRQHHWRIEMHGCRPMAAMVGVSDQFMRDDPSAARAYVAGRLVEARRDMRKVYEATSPAWANSK